MSISKAVVFFAVFNVLNSYRMFFNTDSEDKISPESPDACCHNSAFKAEEYTSMYLSPNISVQCNFVQNCTGNVTLYTGNCSTESNKMLMTYMDVCGDVLDIVTDDFKEDLYRLPSHSMNPACQHKENETYSFSIVYLTEVPPGSDDQNFNLGLVSSDYQNMSDTFCPIFTEIDVKLDPLTALNNKSQIPTIPERNTSANVIASFCVPLNDNCTATISNDNITFSIEIDDKRNLQTDNDSLSTEFKDGRIYVHYVGLVEKLKLRMNCDGNSSNFDEPSCDAENYGMTTSTVSVKTLNKTSGKWETTIGNKFLGVDDGKLVFRTKFFHTDGYNMFAVVPEGINFKKVFSDFEENLADSYTVLVVITCLLVVLIVMTIITLGLDRRDSKNVYHRTLDSRVPCDTSYLIALQTGLTSSRDFRSPLFLEICGGLSSSGTRLLNYSCDGIINLTRGSTTYYYMSVDRGLGPIINIRMWHDDNDEGVLVNKVVILDLSTRKCYLFLVDDWLSIKKGVKLYTSVKPYDIVLCDNKALFPQLVKNKVFDDLLLLSVFVRPDYNHFTRTQRLYCLSAIVSLTMLTSAMWFTTDKEKASYGVSIGSLSINYKQVFTGIMSSLISLPPMLLVTLFFRNYRKRCNERHFDIEELKRQYRLPWGFRIIAWLIVIFIVLLSAFLIFMYSLQWGGDVSDEWLISISFGFIFNTAFGPLKITILSSILVGVFRRKAASDVSTLPIMGVSEKPKYTGQTIPSSSWPGDKDSKEERRREKELELDQRLNKTCFELFSSVLYLTFLCLMAFHDNPSTSYYQNSQLLSNLQPDYQVFKAPDVAHWLSEALSPFLSGSGHAHHSEDDNYMTSDGTSFVYGLIRIRQIREKDFSECINLNSYQLFSTICSVSEDNEETMDFCTGWEKESEDYEDSSWFSYTSKDVTSSYKTYGEFDVYHGGGYVIDVNPVYSNISSIAINIMNLSWLDYKTRFVSVEFTVTNPGSRLFSMTSFKWEFPSMGGTAQKHTVTSFRLYPYMDPFDYLILVVQLCFIVFTLVKIVRIFYRFSNTQRGYRAILLHLLKTALVLLSVTVIVVYVIRIDRTIFTIEKIFNNKEQFISFDQLIFLDDLYKTCLSILIFFHILFLLRHLTYNFHIYLLQNTISIASGQILSCMVFLGIAIIAFSSLQYLFTGRKLSDYRSLYNAMLSLICAALSTAKLSSGKSEIISPFDKLTFFLFGLIVNLILLNLFISILNETLSALKTGNFERGSIPTFDKELNQFVWKKISKIFSLCGVHPQIQRAPDQRKMSPIMDLNRKVSNLCSTVERICTED